MEKYNCNEDLLNNAITKIKNKEVYLYAMSGKMGAGKDTIGDLIKLELENNGETVKQFSYSSPMKAEMQHIVNMINQGHSVEEVADELNTTDDVILKFLEILNGYSVFQRSDNSRLAIQFWGTDVRRKQNPNYWINKLVQMIVEEVNQGDSVFISDVRFENEAKSIEDLSGKVIRLEVSEPIRISRIIKRDKITPSTEHLTHLSETALDNYNFEKEIDASQPIQDILNEALKYITGRKLFDEL